MRHEVQIYQTSTAGLSSDIEDLKKKDADKANRLSVLETDISWKSKLGYFLLYTVAAAIILSGIAWLSSELMERYTNLNLIKETSRGIIHSILEEFRLTPKAKE